MTKLVSSCLASRRNRPGPKGCGGNGASCRCRTWQGNDAAGRGHNLRPTPNLAPFLAATRLATKRQQTLVRFLFDHAASHSGAAATQCLRMVGVVVAALVNRQRQALDVAEAFQARSQYRLAGLALALDEQC